MDVVIFGSNFRMSENLTVARKICKKKVFNYSNKVLFKTEHIEWVICLYNHLWDINWYLTGDKPWKCILDGYKKNRKQRKNSSCLTVILHKRPFLRVIMFLFTLPILPETYCKYSWECIQNMLSFNFYLIFPYLTTSNLIGIVLNWKLRRCMVADDKIYRAIWMNSCRGKNYLAVSCKMYKNILLHLQIGCVITLWDNYWV